MKTLTPSRKALLMVGVGAVLISFSSIMVGLTRTAPTTTAFYRFLFGGLGLLLIALLQNKPLLNGWKPLGVIIPAGIFLCCDLGFWHRSIHIIGPGLATLMTNLQVFIVAGAGVVFLKENPTKNFFLAIPLAVGGLYLILAPDWQDTGAAYELGIFFSLVSATSYAFYILFLRRSTVSRGADSALGNMTMISLTSAGILSIVIFGLGESFAIPEKKDWVFLLIYGLLCHGLGWLFIAKGIAGIPASLTGLVLLLQPTLAFVWDVLIFDRSFSITEAAGAGLTLSAVYLGSSGMNK
ncbi:DMT family transporter [Dethiosulfatarculus sandiegensis]|uniref:EamA domain-containing protein n=1 Tax=Dethiosulfatarculus sandiegensis TaxID=1429043 RepID=A0A0D2JSX1_9BACT|nr:DMT family transporter [Dethiosulfatarculus sandiegensis]KIX12555.1 hypothetical protein X474_18295 [Dethiosulfatarculus sandiegensis]